LILALFVTACGGAAPTAVPAQEQEPTKAPTVAPTEVPTEVPTPKPEPTEVPTEAPATAGLDVDAGGEAILEYVLNSVPYGEWGSWPSDRWNDFSGYLKSGEPHGNVVRIFVNDVAQSVATGDGFEGELPYGSIILKENYMGTGPDDPGELAALTIMYKAEGSNPDGSDWYWVKAAPDGSAIDKEGAVAGCMGCHSQEGNHDFLLRYNFGDEPAVPQMGSKSEGSMESDDAGKVLAEEAGVGKETFGKVCIACHGPDATGIQGLGKDLTTSEFVAGLTDTELVEFITMGRPVDDPLNTTGVAMPPKGGRAAFTDQDIADIVAYLRTLAK